MTPQNKHKKEIDAIIEEFDRLYIHENHWKSDNEEYAYAPIDGMRQFIFDNLHKIYSEGFKAGKKTVLNAVKNILKDHTITAPHVEALILTREMALIMIEKELSSLSNNPQDE